MNLDIIGDIHGCYNELIQLIEKLQYKWNKEGKLYHEESRKIVFLGDLTDRGPNSLGVIDLIYDLVEIQKIAYYTPGNHCNKLYRYFLGRKVQISHGLETTVEEYLSSSPSRQQEIKMKFMRLYENAPLYLQLDNGNLVVAHAGIKESLIGKYNDRVKTFVLYGDITGEKHPDGSPVRRDWASEYTGKKLIVYGHTPVKEVRKINNTYNIDTGAVFGGKLSALRYPELEIVQVPSSMEYVPEKFTTFS